MASSFLYSYLREVISSLPNRHQDNYDFLRFGPQAETRPHRSWKTPIVELLRSRGYLPAWMCSSGVLAAIALVETNLTHFEWLYNRLSEDLSREILVKVLAFRALGHRRVRLPLSTPTYWESVRRMERLANPSDFIPIGFNNWQLHRINLHVIGVPVQLYSLPRSAYNQFVLEQYRCQGDLIDIAVEPGDHVIDAGACWGDTALYFAHQSRPDGRVLSYEFVPENLEILRRNLALNPHLNGRIHIIERAAWVESDVRVSLQGEGPGSRVGVGQNDAPDAGPLTLAIDDLVTQQALPEVDFIKMDIEGAELSALRGATRTIRRFKPKMAISVYHHITDFFKIPEFLASLPGVEYRFFLRHNSIHSEETVLFCQTER